MTKNNESLMNLCQRLESKSYDRQGNEIDLMTWADLFEKEEYKIIEGTLLKDHFISTIWLGINHNLMCEIPPLIFETMVFTGMNETLNPIEIQRYHSEEEAQKGHNDMVERYQFLEADEVEE